MPKGLENSDEQAPLEEVIDQTISFFAKKAYRTILVAYKDMSMEEYESLKADNNDF